MDAIIIIKPVPEIHYHLNMKDVPFTVDTAIIQEQASSTTPVATGDLEELKHLVEHLESKMEQTEVVRYLMASCSKQRKTKREVLYHVLAQQSMYLKMVKYRDCARQMLDPGNGHSHHI